jgi:hypothetical protein
MSFRSWFGPVVASGFIGVVAVGCSSSAAGPSPSDGGTDVIIFKTLDGGGALGDDAGDAAPSVDGTTGKACTSDKDCVSANGPGINVCSSGFPGTVGGVDVQFWSTPICIIPPTAPNCDPAPVGQPYGPQYCDGSGPDDPSSPGICVPADFANPQPGEGLCYPKCTFTVGGKATGCAGSNVCALDWSFAPMTGSTEVTGVGFCQSVCQTDADCSSLGAGIVCQTDIGLCTPKKVTRTKTIGAACSVALDGGADDNTTGACFCFAGNSGSGFCASACVVGGAACPNGWVCDSSETSAPFPGTTVTSETQGVSGFCLPPCVATDAGTITPDAGTPTDAATVVAEASTGDDASGVADAAPVVQPDAGQPGTCPATSTCQASTLAGPDCMP